MMASIDLVASGLINFVCARACAASVRTASSTADFASSVFGLNSFCRSCVNSVPSTSTASACATCSCVSAMGISCRFCGRCRSSLLGRLCACCQRLQQCRVLQNFADELLRARLAIHVSDQVRELLARLEQSRKRVDLASHCRR